MREHRFSIGRNVLSWVIQTLLLLSVAPYAWGADLAETLEERPSARKPPLPGFLPSPPAGGFVLPPLPGLEPAPEPSGPSAQILSFVFEGNSVVSNEALQKVAAPFIGRSVSAADIEDLRLRITRHYVGLGYTNSGAVIPGGLSADGILRIRIIEGRVDEVRIRGQGWLRESYIRERLVRVGEPLNVNVLEDRFRLLLADPLFSKMNARLLPGAEPGRAILDLDVTRARPYQLSVFANNYRPPSIGSEAFGVIGLMRNVTGLGDTLDASYQQNESGGADNYVLGWTLPVGGAGTQLSLRYSQGASTVIEEPLNALNIKSTQKSVEAGVSHPLINTLRRRLVLGLTWTGRETRTTLLGEPFSFTPGEPNGKTRLDALRFYQDYVQRWETQVLALRSTFTAGRDNIERVAAAVAQPDANYFAWLGQAQYAHRVMDNRAQILARGQLQATDNRLLPLERIAVGGVATVRGYRENTLVRDSGYVGSLEFHYPLTDGGDSKRSVDLIPFLDYGSAWNRGEKRDRLASFGIGVSARYYGFSGEIYLAKRVINPPVATSGNIQDKGVHFQVRYDVF